MIIFAALNIFILTGCVNPFAPALSDIQTGSLLGDQTTIDGFFKNFSYAYRYKDTLVYGKLLTDDFEFSFRDYNLGIDKYWGRDEDMLSTYGMFNGTNSCDLVWNEIVVSAGDSLVQDLSRSFVLTVEVNPGDILKVYGRAYFRLVRTLVTDNWRMQKWRDESNY